MNEKQLQTLIACLERQPLSGIWHRHTNFDSPLGGWNQPYHWVRGDCVYLEDIDTIATVRKVR